MDPAVKFLGLIVKYIVNPVIILGFVVAFVFFLYGLVGLIWNADGNDLDQKKKNVMYGIVGLFVMFSVYGILRLVLTTFGISYSGILGL